MVKLEDGFKERIEERDRGKLIAKLASNIFGQERLSCPDYTERVTIWSGSRSYLMAEIYCRSGRIDVKDKEAYQDCLKLAEECEEALKKQFTVRTEYQI
jgi:hypothetical protein